MDLNIYHQLIEQGDIQEVDRFSSLLPFPGTPGDTYFFFHADIDKEKYLYVVYRKNYLSSLTVVVYTYIHTHAERGSILENRKKAFKSVFINRTHSRNENYLY